MMADVLRGFLETLEQLYQAHFTADFTDKSLTVAHDMQHGTIWLAIDEERVHLFGLTYAQARALADALQRKLEMLELEKLPPGRDEWPPNSIPARLDHQSRCWPPKEPEA